MRQRKKLNFFVVLRLYPFNVQKVRLMDTSLHALHLRLFSLPQFLLKIAW